LCLTVGLRFCGRFTVLRLVYGFTVGSTVGSMVLRSVYGFTVGSTVLPGGTEVAPSVWIPLVVMVGGAQWNWIEDLWSKAGTTSG
jgi:hypothetical protein